MSSFFWKSFWLSILAAHWNHLESFCKCCPSGHTWGHLNAALRRWGPASLGFNSPRDCSVWPASRDVFWRVWKAWTVHYPLPVVLLRALLVLFLLLNLVTLRLHLPSTWFCSLRAFPSLPKVLLNFLLQAFHISFTLFFPSVPPNHRKTFHLRLIQVLEPSRRLHLKAPTLPQKFSFCFVSSKYIIAALLFCLHTDIF